MYPRFAQLVEREDLALERLDKSIYTKSIAQADAARDGIARSVRQIAKAYQRSVSPAEKAAARHVLIYLDRYGDCTRKSYNEATAIIHNLVDDLTTHCADELAAIHLDGWVNHLKDANLAFEQLMTERYSEGADRNKDNIFALRCDVDAAYQQIANIINVSLILHSDAAWTDFVNKLNERIGYYRKTLSRRRAIQHLDDGDDGD